MGRFFIQLFFSKIISDYQQQVKHILFLNLMSCLQYFKSDLKTCHFMSTKLCSIIYKTGHFYRALLNIFISRESSCLSILKCGKWKVWSDTWDKNCKKWKNFSSKLTPLFSMFGVLLILLQEQSNFFYAEIQNESKWCLWEVWGGWNI